MRSLITIIFLLISSTSYAATRYVDQTLGGNCSGNYSIANRACNGSDGYAYTTVQTGVNALVVGDKLQLRGGIYNVQNGSGEGCVIIPINRNGTAWTEGNYTKIESYPGEWAVLDGNNNCGSQGYVLGYYPPGADFSDSTDMKYWCIERIEVKNGKGSLGTMNSGIMWQGGPLKIRYCSIHDNYGTSGAENAGGIRTYHLHDSVIEYNNLYRNGSLIYTDNTANIIFFTDYSSVGCGGGWCDYITGGFSGGGSSCVAHAKNKIRYNYIHESSSGIKYKSYQILTGRNTAGGHPPSYTYATWGDEIDHNILYNHLWTGILDHQDFTWMHNNVIDTVTLGITTNYETEYQGTFANVANNNTFLNINSILTGATSYYAPILHWGTETVCIPSGDRKEFYWDLSNITDNCSSNGGGQIDSGSHITSSSTGTYVASSNYFYRMTGNSNLINHLGTTWTTTTSYGSQTATTAPRVAYTAAYDAGNLLWTSASGTGKYIPRTTHVVESGVTVTNAGIGGNHPYLSGVTLPSYIGAVNPDDYAWVDGVISNLSSTSWLASAGSGTPSWIESAGTNTTTYTVTPVATSHAYIYPASAQTVTSGYSTSGTATADSLYTVSVTGCNSTFSAPTWTATPTSNCTVTASATLTDVTPPVISGPYPSGYLSSGTTSTTMGATTDETATCRWNLTDTIYSSMSNTFTTTGSTTHATTLTGLSDGNCYHRYIRCIDGSGNSNTSSTDVYFCIANASSTAKRIIDMSADKRMSDLTTTRRIVEMY